MATAKRFVAKNGLDNNNNSIINVSNPVNSSDVATKAYVDSQVQTKDNTDEITEGSTNLYFTTERARNSVSAANLGGYGSFSYDSGTGVFSYTGPAASSLRNIFSATDAGGDGSFSYDAVTGTFTYTGPSASEVRAHFSAGTGISYDSGTGVISTSAIPNASLANSSVTVGTTAISLGASSTTLAGLTSVTSTSFVGALTGNADTASKWANARTITLGGDLTGSVSIDGSQNVTLTATVAANSVALGTDTTGNYMIDVSAGSGITVSHTQGEGSTATITNSDPGSAQNIFKNFTDGSTTASADSNNDTFKFRSAGGVTVAVASDDATHGDNLLISLSSVPNSSLANSSVTVGTTAISLGGSSTTLAGLTSVTSTGFTGALTGNATSADKWSTARTLSLTGDVTGSVSIDGSGNASLATTIAANSVALGTDTTGNYMVDVSAGTGIIISHTQGEGSTATITNTDLGSAQNIFKNFTDGTNTAAAESNNDTFKFRAGTGVSVAVANDDVTHGDNLLITNTGVTSNVAGTGISVSGATGAVTITNTGVTSAVAGNAITVSGATGAVTISHSDTSTVGNLSSDNSGNTFIQDISLTFDTYGHVTGATVATGTVAESNAFSNIAVSGQSTVAADAVTDTVTFAGSTGLTITTDATNDVVTFTNSGVTSAVAGTGISVSGATGAVTVTNTGVTSVAGTTNQVFVNASTGAVTFSLPQNIHTGASPTFAGATLNSVKVGVTAANEIDTSSGNLVIDSAGGTVTIDDNLTVSGNLIVNGTTTTVNSTVTTLDDPVITLGGDTAPASDDNKDRGIEFRWHNGTAAKIGFFGFDDSTGYFTFIPDATNTSEVFGGTTGILDVASITGSAAKWTTARTLSLTGDVTGSVSIDGSGNASLATTIAANSVALGTDTTGNYMIDVSAGGGISVSHTQGEGSTATISHADTSSAADLSASGRRYVTGLTFDTYGHVTGYTTATETVVDTNTTDWRVANSAGTEQFAVSAAEQVRFAGSGATSVSFDAGTQTVTISSTDTNTTYSAGTGLSLNGTVFNHSNSVTAGTVSEGGSARTLAFGGTFNVPSVTYDAQGHVTSTGTITLTMPANPNTDTNTTYDISAGSTTGGANLNLNASGSGSGTDSVKFASGTNVTVAYTDANTITISATDTNTTYTAGGGLTLSGTEFSHTDTSSAANLTASGRRYVTGLTFDTYGHVTGYTTGTETVVDTNTTDWRVANSAGTEQFAVSAAEQVRFAGSGATSVSFDAATQTVTISSTDTNTTYSATGAITLTGTQFSHTDTSTAADLTANGRRYVTGLTFDTYGHVTGYSTGTETVSDTNTTYSVKASSQTGGAGLDLDAGGSGSGTDTVVFKGSGATTVTYTDANTITISSTDTNTDTNWYVNSASFNTSTGVLTLSRNDGGTVTVDLDGKYAEASHTHSYLSAESDTLATVTGRGATTATAVSFTNATASSSTTTGAVVVTGGVGIGGKLSVGGGAAVTGAITATGEVTAYYSDLRLKTNIVEIENALAKVEAIRGVEFDPNETALALGIENKHEIGVIAQEIEAVAPELVVASAFEGYKTVKYDKLTALLIEAVKELSAKVKDLEAKLDAKSE